MRSTGLKEGKAKHNSYMYIPHYENTPIYCKFEIVSKQFFNVYDFSFSFAQNVDLVYNVYQQLIL